MRKFVVKLSILILSLLPLFGVIEYKARSIPSNFAVKRERLEQNIDKAQVIIAGASHAYYGIYPKLLGASSVSIAYPGQDVYYDTRILLKYLPQAARARLVVITLSYPTLESTVGDSDWSAQSNFYYKFWRIPREYTAFRLADYSAVLLFGGQRSRDFFLNGKVQEFDNVDEFGGNADVREANPAAAANSQPVLKRHNAVMRAAHIAQNVKYLDELFDALEVRGIRAIIVTPPCFESYYKNLDRERYERMQNEIEAICQRHRLEYRNYLKDERFDVEDFSDCDHLDNKGAEKFSLILKGEVIEKYVS